MVFVANFFGMIGGVIAFFILFRQDDFTKSKNCLYLGIAFMDY